MSHRARGYPVHRKENVLHWERGSASFLAHSNSDGSGRPESSKRGHWLYSFHFIMLSPSRVPKNGTKHQWRTQGLAKTRAKFLAAKNQNLHHNLYDHIHVCHREKQLFLWKVCKSRHVLRLNNTSSISSLTSIINKNTGIQAACL